MTFRTFKIPGECRGKMRPKATYIGGHAKVYTPHEQIEYENWVRICYQKAYPNEEPIPQGVAIWAMIGIAIAIPKSFSKKKRQEVLDRKIYPTRKPDLDNAAKSILDALNGIAFHDDSQIVILDVTKFYAEAPAVIVHLQSQGETE